MAAHRFADQLHQCCDFDAHLAASNRSWWAASSSQGKQANVIRWSLCRIKATPAPPPLGWASRSLLVIPAGAGPAARLQTEPHTA